LDKELNSEYFLWRLVLEDVCSLWELDNHYSLDDVLRANALLDMKYYYEKQKEKEPNRG